MSSFKLAGLIGAAGFLVSLPGGMAWSADAAGADELEEIVVTAEKREANLQKVAQSIQTYKGEDLVKQGKRRIDEIMQGVIGVQSQDGQVGMVFYMRGVDAGQGMAGGSGTTVAVLIDGVYQSRGEAVRGGTLDVAQVEVMRGTQSSTLGVSALAGAVSLVTNKPVFNFAASGSLGLGNYNLQSAEGVVNIPFNDNHAIRMAFSKTKRDGYLGAGAGDSDQINARLKYRWLVNEKLDLVATLSHQVIGGNGVQQGVLTRAGVWQAYNANTPNCSATVTANCRLTIMGYPPILELLPGPTFRERANPWDDGYPKDVWPNNPFRNTVIDDYSVELNWDTAVGKLTILPSYEFAHFRSQEPPRGTGLGYMAEDRYQETKQIDVRLASNNTGGKVTWLTGAYYYNSYFNGSFLSVAYPTDSMNVPGPTVTNNPCGYAAGTLANCNTWSYDKLISTETTSVYGDFKWSILDKFRWSVGARFSHDQKGTLSSVGSYVGGTAAPALTQLGTTTSNLVSFAGYSYLPFIEHTYSKLVYSTGLEFDVGPNAMLYGTYKTGYQAGAVDAMAQTFSNPNTSVQKTIGFKSQWFDNRLRFNVEGFDMNFKDRPFTSAQLNVTNAAIAQASCATNIAAVPVPTPYVPSTYACLTPNLSTITVDYISRGFDFEVNYLPSAADRIDFSFETLKSEFKGAPRAPAYTLADLNTSAVGNGATAANNTLAQVLLDGYNARLTQYNGVQLQNAPKYSSNLTYAHRFRMGDSGGTLTPSVNAIYKSAYWSQGNAPATATGSDLRLNLLPGSLVRQDGYVLWNAYLTWEKPDGKFSINGFLRNVQNKPIMTNIGGEPGSTVTYVTLDAPRTFGVTFSATF